MDNKIIPMAVGGLIGATLMVVMVGRGRTKLVADTEGSVYRNKEADHSVFKTCPRCDGKGGWDESIMGFTDWEECNKCHGLGYVPKFIEK